MTDKDNYKTRCALCKRPIRKVFLLSDNKEYGETCAYIMLNGKEVTETVYNIYHKRKILIRTGDEESVEELIKKVSKIRNIPLSELKVRKKVRIKKGFIPPF